MRYRSMATGPTQGQFVADHVLFVVRHPQRKELSPIVKQIKSVKGISCVDQLSFV